MVLFKFKKKIQKNTFLMLKYPILEAKKVRTPSRISKETICAILNAMVSSNNKNIVKLFQAFISFDI